MARSVTIGELAGMETGDCGERILKMPCNYSREAHNFREIRMALEALLDTDIPVERTEPTISGTTYIRAATVSGTWVRAGNYWTAQGTDDGSGDSVSLLMPHIPAFEPNLSISDRVYYGQDSNLDAYVLTEFAESRRGTVRFDANDAPSTVPGWGWADGTGNFTSSAQNFIGWMIEDLSQPGVQWPAQSVLENMTFLDIVIEDITVRSAEARPVIQPKQPIISPKASGIVLSPHLNVEVSPKDIDGTVVKEPVTIQTHVYSVGTTGTSSQINASTGFTNITMSTAGQHVHEWVMENRKFDSDEFDEPITFHVSMNPNGLHAHDIVDPGHIHTVGGHSHDLSDPGHTHTNSPHDHSFSGVSHDHLGSMTLTHVWTELDHRHVQVPHVHDVSATGHDHGMNGDLTQDEQPHSHDARYPPRVKLAMFERIPRGAA